eukprot:TRINITY_DN3513_c1_g1_i2.p1 TRINITY_DN3513_c1_g1~~TRINITY_DN3513_c1_g1_i2.p1  ORF type:complete len:101 (-),score=27.66 TRINITY_DN3513_c1_g1_i2:92-394(-)
MGGASELFFSRLGWDDKDIKVMADALPFCKRLQVLDLWGNNIGDRGAAALAAVVASCGKLTTLYLNENVIGDDGRDRLTRAWVAAGKEARNLKLRPQRQL